MDDSPAIIRILLADPQTLIREGLRALAEQQSDMKVVGQAADGLGMLEDIDRLAPDLVVTEASLPRLDTLEAIPLVVGKHPEMRVLVVSDILERERILALLKSGVTGYLPKDTSPAEFVRAIRSVRNGELVLHSAVGRVIFGADITPAENQEVFASLEKLTEREVEVLRLVKQGCSNKEIAQRLYLSVHTVEVHLRNIYSKLGVRSRLQAALHPTERML